MYLPKIPRHNSYDSLVKKLVIGLKWIIYNCLTNRLIYYRLTDLLCSDYKKVWLNVIKSENIHIWSTGFRKEIVYYTYHRYWKLSYFIRLYQIPTTSTEAYKYAFYPRSILNWNNLPPSVVLIPVTAAFKEAALHIIRGMLPPTGRNLLHVPPNPCAS